MGSSAAKNAAKTMANGANQAGQMVQDAADKYAPQLVNAGILSGDQVRSATGEAADDVVNNAYNTGGSVIDAGKQAAAGVNTAAATGNDLYKSLYNDFTGTNQDFINNQLRPYQQAGQDATQKMSDLADSKFTFSQDDPSYQWRLQQGMDALLKNKALHGSLQSGGAVMAANNYAQGAASQEYQAAFNRFQTDRTNRGSLLQNLASNGLTANNQNLAANNQQLQANTLYGQGVNQNNMDAAKYSGNMQVDTGKFNANLTNNAHQWAGDQRINSEKYAGDQYVQGVTNGAKLQTNAAQYRGDATMHAADATAAGQLGSGRAWSQTISNLGSIGAGAAGKWASNKWGSKSIGAGSGGIRDSNGNYIGE
jgi:hypothetical protein